MRRERDSVRNKFLRNFSGPRLADKPSLWSSFESLTLALVQTKKVLSDLFRYSRRERDSNPRTGFPVGGFQDRCLQPLSHPSI